MESTEKLRDALLIPLSLTYMIFISHISLLGHITTGILLKTFFFFRTQLSLIPIGPRLDSYGCKQRLCIELAM